MGNIWKLHCLCIIWRVSRPRYFIMATTTGEINLDRLERELASAIEADKKYSRENDAKFRAVAQRVATYEEFRQVDT